MRRVTVLLLFSLFFAGFSMAVGGVRNTKTDAQIWAIAKNFNCPFDENFLSDFDI